MGCLDGKVVLIAGAGRGIGRAEALACAAEGARVVVNDDGCDVEGRGSDPSVADAVVAEIRAAGGEAVADPRDYSAPGAAEALVARALEAFGALDAVIASAGIVRERTLLKLDDDDLDRLLDVHVRGTIRLARAAARAMVERGGGGSIVVTTGPSAFFGSARVSGIAACTAAIVGFARSAAVELRRQKVRVNAIAPTARTRATEGLPLFQGIAAGSMAPEHVAPVAVFLASDLSSEVTGEVIGVAGGRVYAIRSRETTGAFTEGRPFTPAEIAKAWNDVTRTG